MKTESEENSSLRKKRTNRGVIRLNQRTYKRLRSYIDSLFELRGRTFSHSEAVDELLGTLDALLHAKPVYRVGNVVFDSEADAWGQAIMDASFANSVKKEHEKVQPQPPIQLLPMGQLDPLEG